MSAQALYDAVRAAIDTHLETDEELSTFELIGVLRMITAELEMAAMATECDEDEDDDEESAD
jgi:hypothetical protein